MITDYSQILRDDVNEYDGKEAPLIKAAPDLFDLLSSLLEDRRTDRSLKPLICAGISYFVTPYDIFPEDVHGTFGYIDDVFFSVYIIHELLEKIPYELFEDHWRGEADLKTLVKDAMAREKDLIGDNLMKIKQYIGLE